MRSIHCLSVVLSLWASQPDSVAAAEDGIAQDFVCRHPAYKPLLVSASPLVVYLKDFITPEERRHLYAVSKGKFSHSAVASGGEGGAAARHGARTSQLAYVARDAVLHCIEERAAQFQGYDISREQIEPLQLVKYGPGERYHLHTDWISGGPGSGGGGAQQAVQATADNGGNRLSSFFAYVYVRENDTTGGGTNFPMLDAPAGEAWCTEGLVNCDEAYENGLTFRPVEGNAVFWQNLHPETGQGDYRTLHAGLPVSTGEKIGMNIWTRQGVLSEEARGPEYYPDL